MDDRRAPEPTSSQPIRAAPVATAGERHWRIALLLLVLATFAIRARYFGNPLIDVDEQFYLLVGDRMLHGAIPYVDIWDRKPIGLFLIYAAIRLLGGDGIVQYQLVSSGFAAATAVMIAIIARRIATPGAALLAALAYVPALAMNGGAGGQTPVFYNLRVAIAVWLVMRVAAPAEGVPRLKSSMAAGAAAMLLIGIAMQIKYTALFEGLFLGCVLIGTSWTAGRRRWHLVAAALLWGGLAILPTVAAWGWYAAIGHGGDFYFANFASIAARGASDQARQLNDLRKIAIHLLPFAVPIVAGAIIARALRLRPASGNPAAYRFLLGWLAAAIAGFVVFGSYFNHYALPLLPPLAVAAAPAFAIRWRRAGLLLACISLGGLFVAYPIDAARYERRKGDRAYARQLVEVIRPRLHGGCLYVFYGEPILYHLTASCLPTRWAFPFHLSLRREAAALGVDPQTELDRIMATRPPVVVDRLTDDPEVNRAVQAEIRRRLRADYRLVFVARRATPGFIDTDMVWERR